MFVFLAFVVVIALPSMWLLYHNQNRQLAGIIEMERQLEKANDHQTRTSKLLGISERMLRYKSSRITA